MAAITFNPDDKKKDEEEKNLTILEHLQELRNRMMICGGALVLAMIVSFYPLTSIVLKWLKHPAESKIKDFELVFTQPLEYWTTFFQVSMMLGVTLAMPIFVWQFFGFVGPGLTRQEKRWIYPITFAASAMFILGCAFAYYVELPPALNFLLNGGDIATPFITVKSYVSFTTRLMLVTGLVFETPFVIMGLAWIGIVRSRTLWRWWRFAIVGAVILAAIVTPSVDPITQMLTALPMMVLYFVGIGLARLVENHSLIPKA